MFQRSFRMYVCISATLALSAVSASTQAATDDLEDIGPNGTVVSTRIIAGVTVAISSNSGASFTSREYDDTTSAYNSFLGFNFGINRPRTPGNISLVKLISTVTSIQNPDVNDPGTGFDEAEPITFSFSSPIVSFGLTTLDLLENGVFGNDTLLLKAFDVDSNEVDVHMRVGPQGGSGLDLDWVVSAPTAIITYARLLTSNTNLNSLSGYGIDDLVVVTTTCPINCPAGDANGICGVTNNRSPDMNADGSVTLADLSLFAQAYPPMPYSYCADFNCDGAIGLVDLATFAGHWLHSGAQVGVCN